MTENQGEKWPRVAIIVLNWNGWRDTIECLESLQRITYPNYQIIVVDNGSTDESLEKLQHWFSRWEVADIPLEILSSARSYSTFDLIVAGFVQKNNVERVLSVLLETNSNLGYSGGNNVGLAWALADGCDYSLILNNDVRVEMDFLNNMIQVARKSNASVVGALIKDFNGTSILFARSSYPSMLLFSDAQKKPPDREWWSTDRVDGSGMLISMDLLRERWQSLGYFLDESLFLYCEEIELGLWCKRAGKKSVIAGGAVVYHKLSKSSGGKGKPLQFYYITRNRILIARKYLPSLYKTLFFVIYIPLRILRAGMYMIQGRLEISQAIMRGVLDGYRGIKGESFA
ncbi:MAG: glycosyltransferase family 2 protein [Candidatus Methanosuratincola petrocarbonis]